MKSRIALVLIAALGGCASTYTEPTLPPDHPASTGASESPPPERSHTLAIGGAGAEPVASMPTARPTGHGEPSNRMLDTGSGEDTHDTSPPMPAIDAAIYVCPMHPEVTSDKPNQRCPKCGMKLKKVEEGRQP